MLFPVIKVFDKETNETHIVGTDSHDQLNIVDGSIHYQNLQNGEGTMGDYSFVAEDDGEFPPTVEFMTFDEIQSLNERQSELEYEKEESRKKFFQMIQNKEWDE